MSEWIRCENRLPSVGHFVWLAVHGVIPYVTIARGEGMVVVEKWWDVWNVDKDAKAVDVTNMATHWQPFEIPEPPKEANDE